MAAAVDGYSVRNDNANRVRGDAVQSPRGSRESVLTPVDERDSGDKRAVASSFRAVPKDVYISYFLAGGSKLKVLLFLFVHTLSQVLTTGSDYWINYW